MSYYDINQSHNQSLAHAENRVPKTHLLQEEQVQEEIRIVCG